MRRYNTLMDIRETNKARNAGNICFENMYKNGIATKYMKNTWFIKQNGIN